MRRQENMFSNKGAYHKEEIKKVFARLGDIACTSKHAVFMKTILCLFALIALGTMANAEDALVEINIDWEKFLNRHDIVWEQLPDRFDHGIWHGNGLLGTVIYKEEGNVVRWELGRSDVTTRRRDNSRVLIGGMGLEPVGEITGGRARYDLWNAESSGTIETTKGTITFRTFIHSIDLVIIIELDCSGEEDFARFNWLPWPCFDTRNRDTFGDPPDPEPLSLQDGDVSLHVQPRYAGGGIRHGMAGGAPGERQAPAVYQHFRHVSRKGRRQAGCRIRTQGGGE